MISLWVFCQQAKKLGIPISQHPARVEFQKLGWLRFSSAVFWELDIIGLILLAAALGLTLTPLSLVHGDDALTQWKDPIIWVPLAFGLVCWPIFIFWERRAMHPMMPYHVSFLTCST